VFAFHSPSFVVEKQPPVPKSVNTYGDFSFHSPKNGKSLEPAPRRASYLGVTVVLLCLYAYVLICSWEDAHMKTKVPVSARALLQRLNRVLAQDDLLLKKARGAGVVQQLGEYYVIDTRVNGVVEKDVDLEAFARKRLAMAAWETLSERGER
jgi:hypothetical protein